MNDTKSDTILDDKPIVMGQACSEQSFFDIVQAEKMVPKIRQLYLRQKLMVVALEKALLHLILCILWKHLQ